MASDLASYLQAFGKARLLLTAGTDNEREPHDRSFFDLAYKHKIPVGSMNWPMRCIGDGNRGISLIPAFKDESSTLGLAISRILMSIRRYAWV